MEKDDKQEEIENKEKSVGTLNRSITVPPPVEEEEEEEEEERVEEEIEKKADWGDSVSMEASSLPTVFLCGQFLERETIGQREQEEFKSIDLSVEEEEEEEEGKLQQNTNSGPIKGPLEQEASILQSCDSHVTTRKVILDTI